MEFSKEQLSTLNNRFAREKMQQARKQPRAKKPRIYKPHYEKADIAALINECTTITKATKDALLRNIDKLEIVSINKRPYTYVFGKKTYINPSDMKYYEGFTIYYE